MVTGNEQGRGRRTADQAETLRLFQSHRLQRVERKRQPSYPARVISITSGKGGVGKTFTTVNLAVTLAQRGKRVLILDGDLGLANIDVMVGIEPLWTLEHVVRGERTIAEVMVEGPYGISIIPSSSGAEWLCNLNSLERRTLVEALEDSALEYDYLLIDTPAGIGPDVMFFNSAAHEILCVVTPEVTSVTDSYALIKILGANYGEKEIKLLVNQAGGGSVPAEREALHVWNKLSSAIERFLHTKITYVGFVPKEEHVRSALDEQRALVEVYPSCMGARAFHKVGEKLDSESRDFRIKGGVQFFFNRLLEARAE